MEFYEELEYYKSDEEAIQILSWGLKYTIRDCWKYFYYKRKFKPAAEKETRCGSNTCDFGTLSMIISSLVWQKYLCLWFKRVALGFITLFERKTLSTQNSITLNAKKIFVLITLSPKFLLDLHTMCEHALIALNAEWKTSRMRARSRQWAFHAIYISELHLKSAHALWGGTRSVILNFGCDVDRPSIFGKLNWCYILIS